MIYQPHHLLLAELHLVSQLLDRLRARGVNVIPNIGPQLLVFFDVHRSNLAYAELDSGLERYGHGENRNRGASEAKVQPSSAFKMRSKPCTRLQ